MKIRQIIRRISFILLLCLCAGSGTILAQKGSKSSLPQRDKAIRDAYRMLNGYKMTQDYKTAARIFR
jgi:hypothetical protein